MYWSLSALNLTPFPSPSTTNHMNSVHTARQTERHIHAHTHTSPVVSTNCHVKWSAITSYSKPIIGFQKQCEFHKITWKAGTQHTAVLGATVCWVDCWIPVCAIHGDWRVDNLNSTWLAKLLYEQCMWWKHMNQQGVPKDLDKLKCEAWQAWPL